MDFQVGEKVIYPNHGVGVVESIQQTGARGVYVLRILSTSSRVWVPCENAGGVGLRPIVGHAEARRILGVLGDGKVDLTGNWKGRFKENTDKMRTGSLVEVAQVLKGLTLLARQQILSFREKRMLERAKFLIVSEIAEVEGKPQAHVEARVDQLLTRSVEAESALRKPVQKPVGVGRRASDA